ncbi:MAG: hypothetical protein K1X79_12890 [Oligoflexia bacterium]|nr:hypothetical protein [Oligoflexia bacterium]
MHEHLGQARVETRADEGLGPTSAAPPQEMLASAVRAPSADLAHTEIPALKLHLPDITHIDILRLGPSHFSLKLTPAEWANRRDPAYWLECAWPDIREEILAHADQLDIPTHTLRRLDERVDKALRILGTGLAPYGALHARCFYIDLELGPALQRYYCVEVRGHVGRFAEFAPIIARRLEKALGLHVDLITREIDDSVRKSYLTDALREEPSLRPPRFFALLDDPRPKLIKDPIDLTMLTFWGFDGEATQLPEDAQACFHTALGPFLLNVVPLGIWGRSFGAPAEVCQAFFCGGIPRPDGSIERARVGRALIKRPHTLRDGMPIPSAIAEECGQHQALVTHAMKEWIQARTFPDARVNFKRAMDGVIRLGQLALVQSVQRTNAPFFVRYLFGAQSPGVRRARDISADEAVIDIKSRQRQGHMNQEQLMRCVLRHPPLAAQRLDDGLRV